MLRKSFAIGIAVTAAALLTPTNAHAWGAAHVGYTHVGPAGVYHYGATERVGPYGAYGSAHSGFYGAGGGAYRSGAAYGGYYGGATYGGAYHYNTGYGAGYHFGTVPIGGYGYAGGAYRRW